MRHSFPTRRSSDLTADRDRVRRAVARAKRPGPDGRAKLGRESNVLLDKVRRMMGEGGGR